MSNLGTTVTTHPSVVITTPSRGNQPGIDEDDSMTLNQYRKKHQRRMAAISPAGLLMLCGGMHLGWGIYTPNIISLIPEIRNQQYHLLYSWFIGAIIGAVISAALVTRLRKCYFMYTGGGLFIINGILFTALSGQYEAIAASRYLAGIAHGLVFVIAVIHAGEIAPKRLRGQLVAGLCNSTTCGIFVASFLFLIDMPPQVYTMNSTQVYGVLFIIISLCAIVFTYALVKESPIFLLQEGNDNEAFSTLLMLQKQTVETPATRQQFMELKDMVNEEKAESGVIISDKNWMPLIHGTILRSFLALAMCMPINSTSFIGVIVFKVKMWPSITIALRLIGELTSLILLDRIGRRKLLIISVGISGALLIFSGIMIEIGVVTLFTIGMAFYQYFLGIGLSTVSTLYLGEAFSLSKKPFSILAIFAVENLIHIIVLVSLMAQGIYFDSRPIIYVTGVFLLISVVHFFKYFPETKDLSLRQCRDAMRQF